MSGLSLNQTAKFSTFDAPKPAVSVSNAPTQSSAAALARTVMTANNTDNSNSNGSNNKSNGSNNKSNDSSKRKANGKSKSSNSKNALPTAPANTKAEKATDSTESTPSRDVDWDRCLRCCVHDSESADKTTSCPFARKSTDDSVCECLHQIPKAFRKEVSLLRKRYVTFRRAAPQMDGEAQRDEARAFLSLFRDWLLVLVEARNGQWSLRAAQSCRNAAVVRALLAFTATYAAMVKNVDFLVNHELYALIYRAQREVLVPAQRVAEHQLDLWRRSTHASAAERVADVRTVLANIADCVSVWRARESAIWDRLETACASLHTSSRVRGGNDVQSILQRQQSLQASVDAQTQTILSDLQNFLDKEVFGAMGLLVRLTPFGSRMSLLGTLSSDLDVSLSLFRVDEQGKPSEKVPIAKSRGVSAKTPSQCMVDRDVLVAIRRRLRNKSGFSLHQAILGARVPILKMIHTHTRVEVDICLENQLGVQNTYLLRDYVQQHPSIHTLLLSVKHWANQRCCNQSQNGTLSSFSWSLLALHSLQQQGIAPKVRLSALGRECIAAHESLQKTLGVSLAFSCPENARLFEFLSVADTKTSHHPLVLLLKFFQYFGTDCAGNSFDFFGDSVDITEGSTGGNSYCAELSEDDKDDDDDDDDNDDDINDDEDRNSDHEAIETAKTTNQSNSWRIHTLDVFDRRDLGAVMRSKGTQQFVHTELRRALYYLYKMTVTDNSTACASLFARSDIFPDGEVKFCPSCDCVRVDNRRCPCRIVCEYCSWFGHTIQSCPHHLAPKPTPTVATAASATEPQQQNTKNHLAAAQATASVATSKGSTKQVRNKTNFDEDSATLQQHTASLVTSDKKRTVAPQKVKIQKQKGSTGQIKSDDKAVSPQANPPPLAASAERKTVVSAVPHQKSKPSQEKSNNTSAGQQNPVLLPVAACVEEKGTILADPRKTNNQKRKGQKNPNDQVGYAQQSSEPSAATDNSQKSVPTASRKTQNSLKQKPSQTGKNTVVPKQTDPALPAAAPTQEKNTTPSANKKTNSYKGKTNEKLGSHRAEDSKSIQTKTKEYVVTN